jgi:hypothetical protein
MTALTGCLSSTLPQTRDEFVQIYKQGGAFRDTQRYTVNRPVDSVAADISKYAERCLNTSVVNRQIRNEARSATTYRPKMGTTRGGVKTLSVQKSFNGRNVAGAPPGGMFSLVAEFRPAGRKTKIDVYHAGEGSIAEWLKKWAEGDTTRCPSLQ